MLFLAFITSLLFRDPRGNLARVVILGGQSGVPLQYIDWLSSWYSIYLVPPCQGVFKCSILDTFEGDWVSICSSVVVLPKLLASRKVGFSILYGFWLKICFAWWLFVVYLDFKCQIQVHLLLWTVILKVCLYFRPRIWLLVRWLCFLEKAQGLVLWRGWCCKVFALRLPLIS